MCIMSEYLYISERPVVKITINPIHSTAPPYSFKNDTPLSAMNKYCLKDNVGAPI